MPCLGARKKSSLSTNTSSITLDQGGGGGEKSSHRAMSVSSHTTTTITAQVKQENNELKYKNVELLEMIAKQTVELEQLRNQLAVNSLSIQQEEKHNDDYHLQAELSELQDRHEELLALLAKKEEIINENTKKYQNLMNEKKNMDDNESLSSSRRRLSSLQEQGEKNDETVEHLHQFLEEKDRLLEEREHQLEELKSQWEAERAELVKPVLEQVNSQLEELKETNKIAVERLTEKENELAELRSQLNRRDRKPKQSFNRDQENQRRLNRLTLDLENDRLLIQKLDELNQQLETQKQKHENVLESHAKVIAEKDKALLQQQKSLKQLKIVHDNATKQLEQEQIHHLRKLQLKHEKDMDTLQKRLKQAESKAKSNVNDELDQILVEFEQSQHNHSVQVAHLEKSYQEQISVMRKGQQAELQSLIVNTTANKQEGFGPRKPSVSKLRDSKFTWPPSVAT